MLHVFSDVFHEAGKHFCIGFLLVIKEVPTTEQLLKLGFSQAFDEIWRPAELGVFRDLKQTRRYSGIRILRVVSNHGGGDCGAAKYTHEREISRRHDARGAPKISACAFRPRHNRHRQN